MDGNIIWKEKEWFPVPGYDGYYASRDGEILSKKGNPRIMSPIQKEQGHSYVFMYTEQKRAKVYVHRAVLSAVRGKEEKNLLCRHLDDDATNNNADNLEWGTYQDNADDRRRNKGFDYGELSSSHKLTNGKVMEIRERYANGESSMDLSEDYGVSKSAILEAVKGETWSNLPLVEIRVKHASRRKTPISEEHLKLFVEGGKRYALSRKKSRELIPCACGCGTMIEMHDSKGRRRKYFHGHNAKGQHWRWNKNNALQE
jgi:hypothetical protein